MNRESLVDQMASAMHAEICACGGTGATPVYYQRAARRALDIVEAANRADVPDQGAIVRAATDPGYADEVVRNMLRPSDERR